MHSRCFKSWATGLFILLFILSACAPRPEAGAALPRAQETDLVVDLPAVVIDIAETGTASVGNVPVAQLGDLVGLDLSTLSIPPAWVKFLQSGNIQHIQVNNTPDGLVLLVNGEPIPSIAYENGSLTATAEALSSLGMVVPLLDVLLPMVDEMGVGAIVHFPLAEGEASIPLHVEGDGSTAAAARRAQEQFLADVGAPPRINLPVFYDDDGSWHVGNLTDTEWTALTGQPFWALRMNPAVLNDLSQAGVNTISISTDQAGIRISVNGNHLPTLTWRDGELHHLVSLANQLRLFEAVAPDTNTDEILALLDQLLPVVTATDFDLTVHMPPAGLARQDSGQ